MTWIRSLSLLFVILAFAVRAQDVPVHEVACETVWEVPGETADYLLGGLLVAAGWDREGRLCVVDYKNKDLKVFAADGRYLRTLGREGEGPGESRDARGLLLADDGRVGLIQMFPACVVWLQPDGDPGGKLTMENTLGARGGYVGMPHTVQYPGGVMAYMTVMALEQGGITENHWIAPANLDGTFGTPVWHRVHQEPPRDGQGRLDESDLYFVWAARWAPDGRGGVWVAAERDRYRIAHYGHDGTRLPDFGRDDYALVRRDDLGRQQALEQLTRRRYARDEVVLRDTAPVVARLRLADTGNLWVDLDLGGRGHAEGTIAHIDVYDPEGLRLRQLAIRGEFDPEVDQRLFVDDRHLVVLHADRDEVTLRLLRLLDAVP
jgi:hypothetical protein